VAAEYALLRPSYPADAVAFLLGSRPRTVLDLGAGTGLLTAVVRASGHEVIAVDPAGPMLAELAARLPEVRTVVGTAEQVPLADGSVDAVVSGQAAHWFDPVGAAAEMRRLLRPGGVVGLVWNARDLRVPWVLALDDVIGDAARNHAADQGVVDAFAAELGARVEHSESSLVQEATPEQVVGSIGTRSYVAVMDSSTRAAFLDRVRDLLATHPDTRGREILQLPYRTDAYRLTPS
jgi:SAM-dependent methyltransferase